MYLLKINNNYEIPIKIKLYRRYVILNVDELSELDSSKISLNSNNQIQIIKDNNILKEYLLNPIIENYKELFNNMKNNDIYCNVDIYEELVPFKYMIKKVENNLYYESFSFLFNNSIEK